MDFGVFLILFVLPGFLGFSVAGVIAARTAPAFSSGSEQQCVHCEYVLTGLAADAPCPECGRRGREGLRWPHHAFGVVPVPTRAHAWSATIALLSAVIPVLGFLCIDFLYPGALGGAGVLGAMMQALPGVFLTVFVTGCAPRLTVGRALLQSILGLVLVLGLLFVVEADIILRPDPSGLSAIGFFLLPPLVASVVGFLLMLEWCAWAALSVIERRFKARREKIQDK
ncbi:MAG TPA: hypothetical protein VG797_06145 [Phycisphaerales bacterium]|nr:hypothetical protein [Phycisphaerales bacterium]